MTYPEDAVPAGSIDPDERAPETPEDEVAEQAMAARSGSSDSLEAPEWDAQEQSQIIEYDDDYR